MGMTDLEKVINGLRKTIDVIHSFVPNQYWYDTETPCDDAIVLLKAQAPRVMSLKEVRTTKPAMYIMYKSEDEEGYLHEYALFSRAHDGITEMIVADSNRPLVALIDSDYGKVWICWTSKPSNEQMKAAKWE